MATKKNNGSGMAKRKQTTPTPRRSADAAEGAAKAKAARRTKATGQTATSSMDAASRRYSYRTEPRGGSNTVSVLKDKVSGVNKITENFPDNKSGYTSRSRYRVADAKTAARALKNNARYADYMKSLSAGRTKKK